MIQRKHKIDKKTVLIHELGHFLCGLRGACKYCPDDIQSLLDGTIHIEEDNGWYGRDKDVTYDDINKMLLAGGAFMVMFWDGENITPRNVRKSNVDYQAWFGGANSDLVKFINQFGDCEMYKTFRTLKEWIGPDDILCMKELYDACEGKEEIPCQDLEPILYKYYYQVRVNRIKNIKNNKLNDLKENK